jgi:hypothetical protein
MIAWYHKYLYDEWYNSLSSEEQAAWDKMQEEDKQTAVAKYYIMAEIMKGMLRRVEDDKRYF